MSEKLENKFGKFKGRVSDMGDDTDKPGYKFVKMISEGRPDFIGWSNQIPSYIEEGVMTEVYYTKDKEIMAFTIPR